MFINVLARVDGGKKEVVSVNESFSWDQIVEALSSKFSLESLSSVILMDSDGDRMSPPVTTAVKFHKFCRMHTATASSFFEINGKVSSTLSNQHNSMAARLSTTQNNPPPPTSSKYSRPRTYHPGAVDDSKPDNLTTRSSATIIKKKMPFSSEAASRELAEFNTKHLSISQSVVPTGDLSATRRAQRQEGQASSPPTSHLLSQQGDRNQAKPITSISSEILKNHDTTVHNAASSHNLFSILQQQIARDKGLLESKDMEGNTPLHIACNSSNAAAIEWLIGQGSDVMARNLNGSTPLHFICATGQISVLRRIKSEQKVTLFDVRNDSDLNLLHTAAQRGQSETALWLCEQGGVTCIDAVNDNGLTALHLACWGNHLAVAKVLVSKGAHMNIRDLNSLTPIFFACSFGDVTLVRWLVSQGALIHTTSDTGDTPLHFACRNGHEDIVRYLVSSGADPALGNRKGATPLDKALLSDNAGLGEVVRELVRANSIPETTLKNITDFHKACALGNIDKVKSMLDQGWNVDVPNASHSTGLHYAVRTNELEMCEFLVSQGAKADSPDRYTGMTPLHTACLKGNVDAAIWLIDNATANPNILSLEGRSTLHYACFSGKIDLIEELIDIGVSVNGTNTDGYTPFHDCCCAGNVEAAQYLLERGASMYTKTCIGSSALHIACKYGHLSTVEWLLDSFRDKYDVPDYHGMTPFLIACAGGHLSIARKLANKGANVNMQSYGIKQRNSALHFACVSGSIPLVEWLLRDMGMNPNKINSKQKTPYILCSDNSDSSGNLLSWMRENAARYSIELGSPSNSSSEAGGLLNGASPLHGAAGLGDLSMINRLLEHGSDINSKTVLGLTPLHFACMQGELEAAKLLVENGADASLCDRQGKSACDLALSNGHDEIVSWLSSRSSATGISKKKKVLAPSIFSCFPVDEVASGERSNPKVQSLRTEQYTDDSTRTANKIPSLISSTSSRSIDDEIRVDEGKLCDACTAGDLSLVRKLVEKGVNVDAVCSPASRTPLHCAVLSGSIDVVRFLLSKKIRVNVQNVGGMTPLHIACDRKNDDIALLLIHKGADINTPNNAGSTSLHIIVSHSLNDLLRRVLALPRTVLHDIDLTVKNSDGRTLMHIAAEQNNLELVGMLSGYPQLVNARDEIHRTPLHYACAFGHVNIAEMLLDSSAFVNARDDVGMTPLLCACSKGNMKLAKILVANGASVQSESDEGNALHIACRAGDLSIVKWLVKHGVNPNEKGHFALSPIQSVDKSKYPHLLDWLLAWNLSQDTGKSIDVILSEMRSAT